MTRPTFPLISITKDKWVDLIPKEGNLSIVTASELVDPTFFDITTSFDCNGIKWHYKKISETFNNTLINRVLAKTFYNPRLDATVLWTSLGAYKLDELKAILNHCVDNDDDVITQFEEPDVIKIAIDHSQSFDDLIKVLNKYVFDVNEEELLKGREIQTK